MYTLEVTYIWGSLDPGGSHCILGLSDPGGQWVLGYSDRGSLYPRTERPGGHWMGGSLKPTTAVQMKSRNPLWNPEIRLKSRNSLEIQKSLEKSTLKSRNSLEIQKSLEKSTLKSRNPLWNPEIRLKSRNLSRNPLWNPEIHSEIRNPLEIQWISKSRTPRRAVADPSVRG